MAMSVHNSGRPRVDVARVRGKLRQSKAIKHTRERRHQ